MDNPIHRCWFLDILLSEFGVIVVILPARVVGDSRAAVDDTGSGGSGGSGACPKPLVLLEKQNPYLSEKIAVILYKTNVFREEELFCLTKQTVC